jgi:hypothetical protein
MSPRVVRIADDPLATIKQRPTIGEIKDSEILWLVAEVDSLRFAVRAAYTELERVTGKRYLGPPLTSEPQGGDDDDRRD